MNNRLTSYQLQDFAEEDGNSVFSDPDYAVASPLLLFPDEEESIKVNFLMMLFCLDGNLCLNFDDRKIELFAGDLLLVPPNVIVHSIRKSERCLITMVGYSLSAVRRLMASIFFYVINDIHVPAIGIILEHAVDKIRAELKYTDIPIKEIAERFGFDDYASFCKFVKTHIGCSPQNCRNS